VLAPDAGIPGLVICLKDALDGMEQLDETRIRVAAGVTMTRAAVFAAERNLGGMEFAHGIPGTVGGAVCMNAGAYDGEMKLVIEQVMVYFPGEGVREIAGVDMDFSYRHSLLSDRPEAVVLSAVFRLKAGDPEVIRERMRELMARRKASQPLEFPSAGSTFKRPTGYFAGTLIDQNGLKGLTVGGAQVSEKHAGFVINVGNATFKDVTGLIEAVQERIFAATGVHLEPEVKIIRS
jgi:UDP-N-acetylmuramate dehydrogenase